jgi:hypothetical protein
MLGKTRTSYLVVLLSGILTLFSLKFYDWPVNRDITTYAVMARELVEGQLLYVDVWDIKPPAIFVAYMIAQWLVSSKPLQILLLDLLPSIIVLVSLIKASEEAGFGRAAGAWAGLFWIALSGHLWLQMHEPNTEIFINACLMLAFWQLLALRRRPSAWTALSIGVLFGIATLFKTVAIVIAIMIGLAYLALSPKQHKLASTSQLAIMALGGGGILAATFGYFAVTGRLWIFWEVLVDAGATYAGDIWRNILEGFTLSPFVGSLGSFGLIIGLVPWLGLALVAWLDREHRAAWLLLGAYSLAAFVAVSLPGNFYAHYFQLLVPPFCLGMGWLAVFFGKQSYANASVATTIIFGICLLGIIARQLPVYLMSAEAVLRGTYQEVYLETQRLGQRLAHALRSEEQLYQWGEESGLYWYSGKRPPPSASVLRWPLFRGPQARRLEDQTLEALLREPPDLIVAANRILDRSKGQKVFEWIQSRYKPRQPDDAREQAFFTFFVPATASPEQMQRMLKRAQHPSLATE